MRIADQPGQLPGSLLVVVNHLGQYSLWPAAREVPPGWRRQGSPVSRGEGLAAVAASWRDLTPATARPAGEAGRPGLNTGPFAHELFARQAARQPEATAVVAGRARVTYRELDQLAGRVARRLRQAGAGPETVTGVHLDRSIDWIGAVLGIMRAGGGYLPLDPSLPAERLERVCSQAGPVAVLTARAADFPVPGQRLLPGTGDDTGPADTGPASTGPADTEPPARPHPDNLAYVIYTSGSTGDPKAVAVSFGSLAGVIAAMTAAYQLTPDDRVAQVAAMAFDTSIEQALTALTAGATLVLPPPGTMAPSELLRGIERRRVTVIDLTPAYWHQVLALAGPSDQRLRSVRLMITGGEQADPDDCRAALRAAPWARLVNAYGLTETTITSALFEVGPWLAAAGPGAPVPVGQPAGGARFMVLDDQLDPVPAGTQGEVYIGGPVVARGYLGRPELTAERFLPDPGGAPGSRMYRTGDLGRRLADGSLEVAGRADRQLKVRGFRVEPGEIEAVLAGHPEVGEVLVKATHRSSGDTRLVAYYTPPARPRPASTPPDRPRPASTPAPSGQGPRDHPPAAVLRRYLAERLPGYMIPAVFVARHHLPHPGSPGHPPEGAPPGIAAGGITAAGDRLPAAERQTPVQAGLAALWGRLLGRDGVRLDDDFFALGGNSLLAAEMLAHTRAMLGIPADSVQPLTRCLLRDPTLRGFAAAATEASAGRLSPDGDQGEIDFAAQARLGVQVIRAGADPGPAWRAPREVLLTGATGFLGAHLLSELTAATGARVHCLVRADGEAVALSRIVRAAARYELPAPPPGRVVPLPGDLSEPRLGLTEPAFRRLAQRIDVIYHAGALVNFIYPYQELRAANVAGTRELIRLAGRSRGIPLHYVSTTAVLAGLGMSGVRTVTEETPLAHPELLRMGYVETKYVAEELLRAAGRAGLPVAVYRPLDIVGSMRTGAWHTATEMCALIRFITDTGLAPDIDLPLDYVAADVCAAAIRHI